MKGCLTIGFDCGSQNGDRTVYSLVKDGKLVDILASGDPVWVWINTKWYPGAFVRLFELRGESMAYVGLWPRERATAPLSDLRKRRPSLNGADIPKLTPHQAELQTDIFAKAL